jgi:hypothetical protein
MRSNETYNKVHVGELLSGLKQGDALSPLLFNFALEYAMRKVQENQVGSSWSMLMILICRAMV